MDGATVLDHQRSYVKIESRVKGPPAIEVKVVAVLEDLDEAKREACRIYDELRAAYADEEGS